MTQEQMTEKPQSDTRRWWKQDWFVQGVILAVVAAFLGAVFTVATSWLFPPREPRNELAKTRPNDMSVTATAKEITVQNVTTESTTHQLQTVRDDETVDSTLMVPSWANKAWVGSLHGSRIDMRLLEDQIGKTTIIDIKGLPNDPSEIRIKGIDLFYHIMEGQLVCTANNYLNSWVRLEMIDNNRIQLSAFSDAEFKSPLWHVVLHEDDVAPSL